MDEATFRVMFKDSPIKRTKRRGLVRNAALALGNVSGADARTGLERLAADDSEPVLSDAARWASTRPRLTS